VDGLTLYYTHVLDCIRQINEEERENIECAARAMFQQIQAGKTIHCFGPGVHSYIGVEEMFYRKGGLIPINPYLAIGLSANVGARMATLTEGQPEYANAVLAYYGLQADDLLIVFNAYGFNACAVQSALRAREIGATTIALTATAYSRQVPAAQPRRHPGGQLLCDIADIVVDIKMAAGETVVPIATAPGKAGGTATILHAYVINCLAIRVAEMCAEARVIAPIWCVEHPDHNQRILAQFQLQMSHF